MANAFIEYRRKIINQLIDDKDLCELVLNREIEELDSETQDELTKKHIFKFRFVPPLSNEEETYISFDMMGKQTKKESLYKNVVLTFYVFSHFNIIYSKTHDLRTDMIDERIQYLFNENANFGLGLMYCDSDDVFQIGDSYYGRKLTFCVKDQNTNPCG